LLRKNNTFLVELLFLEKGLIQKQVYFGAVTLHQKQLPCFCAAKISFLGKASFFRKKVFAQRK